MDTDYDSIVISPHIDDAFLSLGGYLTNFSVNRNQLRRIALVVNVFSISNWAPLRRPVIFGTKQISQLRRKEELLNSQLARIPVEFLDFLDAPLRGYASPFERPAWSKEEELIEGLRTRLASVIRRTKICFFPLGIGMHVDHLFVAKVGVDLVRSGARNIAFYEDLPYAAAAATKYGLIDLMVARNMFAPILFPINPILKMKACGSYKSQLTYRTSVKIILYSKRIRLIGGFYERVWVPVRFE